MPPNSAVNLTVRGNCPCLFKLALLSGFLLSADDGEPLDSPKTVESLLTSLRVGLRPTRNLFQYRLGNFISFHFDLLHL
jgi:hypothetical protein